MTSYGLPLYLYHHGIKGMRWGIRRFQKKDGSLTNAGKERYSDDSDQKTGKKISYNKFIRKYNQKVYGKNERTRAISEEEAKSFDDNKVVIKKGTEFHRIAGTPEAKLNKTAYASYLNDDVNRYRAVMPASMKQRTGKSEAYDITLKATTDIISPSRKARVQAYIDLIDSPISKSTNGSNVKTGRDYYLDMVKNSSLPEKQKQQEIQRITLQSARQLGLDTYNAFSASLVNNSDFKTAYFKKIRDDGYNAIIDDFDRGLMSNSPVILLDTEKTVKRTDVKRMTNKDVKEARRHMREVTERR